MANRGVPGLSTRQLRDLLVLGGGAAVAAFAVRLLVALFAGPDAGRWDVAVLVAIAAGAGAWAAVGALRDLTRGPRRSTPSERMPTQRLAGGLLAALALTVAAGAWLDPPPGRGAARWLDRLLAVEIALVPVVLLAHAALRLKRRPRR